jgi:thiol-disulfide isomerase/thioredoxin
MKLKHLLFLLITAVVLSLLAFLGYKTYRIQKIRKAALASIQQLPGLPFYFPRPYDGSGKTLIINYFSPDCEHCQYMAGQIRLQRERFRHTELLMITPAGLEETQAFMKSYGLDTLAFIRLGIDTGLHFFKVFGSAVPPSYYLYDDHRRLIRSIAGETKIENLIRADNE